MKVGVLGTGDVGKVLGSAMIQLGHEVKMGSREATNSKSAEWKQNNSERASTGTFVDAAKFGEIIFLCTLWSGTENALRMAGPENLSGKVVIDTTNPLIIEPNQPPRLALGHTDSGGEQVQRWISNAKVVKAFNIVGNAHMFHPKFECGPPTMLFCGNDASAKKQVTDLLSQFGWESIDLGGIEGSRLLEPMCILWVNYGFQTGTWNHAFKLLTTKAPN
ncbi:NAD(P)-binding domain-containing protein [bacterium]|nr:NAD(P)-binding domain-containing protein [bacterium]